jgi:hypothetical protein
MGAGAKDRVPPTMAEAKAEAMPIYGRRRLICPWPAFFTLTFKIESAIPAPSPMRAKSKTAPLGGN